MAFQERRAGFTLLELTMALALTAIVAVKAHGALATASEATSRQTREIVLEDQARRVLRQIGYEIMGSNRETLIPDVATPMSTQDLRFQVSLGVQDGEVVWADPEQVAMEEDRNQVFWCENPGTDDERRVVWTSLVAPFLEGEIPNGMDDNGNGLIDEKGLSFVVDGDSVTTYLTLERIGPDGETFTQTERSTVTCRNLNSGVSE